MAWSWIKKNVLGETPIIGGFFTETQKSEAVKHALKMTTELTGSSIAMVVFMSKAIMPMEDSNIEYARYYALMISLMALGMMVGAISFNITASLTHHAVTRFFKQIDNQDHYIPLEESPLTTPLLKT